MKIIDCRNMACPAPVISVKKALEEHGELQVLLDNGAPRENVGRFARNRGFQVSEEQIETGAWALSITSDVNITTSCTSRDLNSGRVLLITSNCLGEGPEELGRLLMKNFIHTLLETRDQPTSILFLNSGIFLTTDGSDVLEALEKLKGMGVEILSCGLCLDFFGCKEKLRVGGTTNMLSTAENLLSAAQVIKL
ncbi:MAG: SirA family protein [Desulfuromonadaceae bacterium GWB2_53_15]|nr:MAG: SirA family protein [Desulfuromonadales bacterium GWD2_54_10]OHB30457.1 MAG: SirA family protein [Desulfuromonadaceae bacterium GWB2_53_15]